MKAVIDSRQLLTFAALARHQSFTAAAKELFLTQSAVSHAIKALEGDLGVRIFDRVGKRAHLTQAGEQLLRHAERILREMHDARSGMEELQSWGQSRLRVGASVTACQYLLPTVLREFKQSFPSCTLRIEPGDGPRMVEQLHANQIDVALMLEPTGHEELDFRRLFQDDLQLLVSPMHEWARTGRVKRQTIADETFVLYSKGSFTFRLVEGYFRKEGVTLRHFIELGSMEAMKELVKIGLGVGVIAPWIARKELAEGSLVAFPIGPTKLRRVWGVGHLRGRRLGLAEETFVGLCENVAETLRLTDWDAGDGKVPVKKRAE